MLGRVRASSISSLELLEMERPPPKIVKHDSLSIYESTLLKLKQGSQCNPRCNPEDCTRDDETCIMAVDSPEEADCSTIDSLRNSGSRVQSTGYSDEQTGRNMSILHFFSKCKSSQHDNYSKHKEVMVIEIASSSSSSSSVVLPTSTS